MDALVNLSLLGVNHRNTPLELRERLDFSKRNLVADLGHLKEALHLSSAVLLSTCNRVELYTLSANQSIDIAGAWTHYLRESLGLVDVDLTSFVYEKKHLEVIRHLFRVASSLDSLIVGEPQILGQLREAYAKSLEAKSIDHFMARIMEKAFSVAKRVRTQTEIGKSAVSVSFAAIELSKQIFGSLKSKSAVLVGAGDMAELCAQHLKANYIERMYVANRSYERAAALAERFSGITVSFDRFVEFLVEVDVAIVSTGASDYVLSASQMTEVMRIRKNRPIFVIDISVPRNVDPLVGHLDEVYLYNIDDLQGVANENLKLREGEAKRAEEIIALEVEKFSRWWEQEKASDVLALLQAKWETMKQSEIERLQKNLGLADPEHRATIDRAFNALIKKAMHGPIVYVKEGKSEDLAERRKQLMRIFNLDEAEQNDGK